MQETSLAETTKIRQKKAKKISTEKLSHTTTKCNNWSC
jgi:hypothetical protein